MKLKTIKTLDEVMEALSTAQPIERKPIELNTTNGTLNSIRIGGLHVTVGQYGSGIALATEALYDEATRYRVTATTKGFPPVTEYFENYGDAVALRDSFDSSVETKIDDAVKVLIDDDGNVVGEIGGVEQGGCDLPF